VLFPIFAVLRLTLGRLTASGLVGGIAAAAAWFIAGSLLVGINFVNFYDRQVLAAVQERATPRPARWSSRSRQRVL
jgi:hypothetical protein